MNMPRIMIAAASSGSGKTLITCGLLQILKNRELRAASFKCGPDYIDPMFHTRVFGTPSANLDTWFTDDDMVRYLLGKRAAKADISVMEGVMGFYDGLGGIDTKASAYDLAKVTKTPVVLVINTKGMSLSVLAQIKGFLNFRPDCTIKGVILNQMSGMLYPQIKAEIEKELGITCLGYVPVLKGWHLESRHLGLVMPAEVEDLERHLEETAKQLEETLDVEGILELSKCAEPLDVEMPVELKQLYERELVKEIRQKKPVIALAADEAFCFFYRDNLELLESFGAKLVRFSPVHDKEIPEGTKGMLLYGGYPELFAKQLSENASMRKQVRQEIEAGMPYMAECGGFLYLHETMKDMEGTPYEMVGALEGEAYHTGKLQRFGYITLTAKEEHILGADCGSMKGHSFHYYDTSNNGTQYVAAKPKGNRRWDCMIATDHSLAGFPHQYYHANPRLALEFLQKCMTWEG